MKTRTTKKTAAKATAITDSQSAEPFTDSTANPSTLPPSTSNPPLLFIFPANTIPDARIITLPNPATSIPSRYYISPSQGTVHEFTKIAAPKQTPRSWLLAPPRTEESINCTGETRNVATQAVKDADTASVDVSTGYVVQDASLLLATPLDPLFLLLPALVPRLDETKQLFLSIEDHLDALAENSKHLNYLIRSDKLRATFEHRANAVCESIEMGEEKMYRLSNQKLLAELVKKAKAMTEKGLPASLDQRFVHEALKAPHMGVHKEESSISVAPSQSETQNAQDIQDTLLGAEESQTSSLTTPSLQTQDSGISVLTDTTATPLTSAASSFAAPAEETTSDTVPGKIVTLLRLRTALNLLLSSYIPASLRPTLLSLISTPTPSPSSTSTPIPDFSPLNAHLTHIAHLKKEQQLLRTFSDNTSRKRSGGDANLDGDEAEALRAEKKRKKEEEEARKKNMSRGVKKLAKVNTTGMKKMSSFFTSAGPKGK